ncbi:MAG TPA: MerR family DNA-binding protein [Gammaproteobacteria bacterium]|nr:MerR family DNA-binding protein [Gammaproteobacteria bacterium]
MGEFTIGRLAKAAGVGVETVRFYQRKKLLAEPPRGLGSIRRYSLEDVARLRFIRAAQELGFSLGEVSELLSLEDGGSCRAVQRLAQAKLDVIRERIEGLKRVQRALTTLLGQCSVTKGRVKCPIIASLEHSPVSSR